MTNPRRGDDRDESIEPDDDELIQELLAQSEAEPEVEVDSERRAETPAAPESSDDEDDESGEIDPALIAEWSRIDPAALYADLPAQRIGRRGFMVGLAAAGVPLAVMARILNRGDGNDVSRLAAPAYQEASPAASPVATPASPESEIAPSDIDTASPEAIDEAEANPFGQLTLVRTQTPVYTELPVGSDTLRIMLTLNNNSDFSPVAYSQDFQIMASYLDPLVWIDERTMEPQPWLAESWSIDDENRRIIFTLREGVTWHDGTPLTQEDVVFSLLAYRDDVNSAVRNFFVTVRDVKAVGSRSVAVEMSSPDANFIPNGGSQFIFSSRLLKDHWESRPIGQRTLSDFDWDENPPVGTGPWAFTEQDDDSITFERNDDYWAAEPAHFETLVFTWDTDPRTRSDAWKRGEVDLLYPVRAHELNLVNDRPGLLFAADAPVVMFAQFNRNNSARPDAQVLEDVRVRQALTLAIDRRRYADELFYGLIDTLGAGTFPQPWLRDESQVNPAISRRTARELLNEAGFRRQSTGTTIDPFGQPFALNVITRLDARYEMRASLRMIAEDLDQLGISLRVEELGDEAFNERWIRGHDFDLIAFSYQVYPGFTDFDLYGSNWDIRINPQGWNPGGYSNETVDGAIRDALTALTLDDVVSAVEEIQVVTNDDLFGLWLGFPQDLILTQPDLLGFEPVMHWQTWHTRKLWKRPANAIVPETVVR